MSTRRNCDGAELLGLPGLPALGAGISYTPAIEPLLARHPAEFDVVEIEPQTTWVERPDLPERYRELGRASQRLAQLPGRKIVHSIGVPVGGTVRPDPDQLALLKDTVEYLQSPWITEHLSFNSAGEFSTGFFLPPLQTCRGVESAARNILDLKMAFDVPVGVETGVNYLRPRPDEMADGEFVAAVIETADCGLLLDLHNIFANSLNGRQSVKEYLKQLPLDRVWEIHMAGGLELDGYWLDAHSGAIPASLLDIAREVVPDLPNLKAIIFEIFPSFVPRLGLDGVRKEIAKLHDLWQMRGLADPVAVPPPPVRERIEIGSTPVALGRPWQPNRSGLSGAISPGNPDNPQSGPSPVKWERALGSLTVGKQVAESDRIELGAAIYDELTNDSGVPLLLRLVHEFRASMVVGVLRLTSRLLILALGPETFQTILEDFWSQSAPHQYAATEAGEFARYLAALDLKLPMLGMVMKFELATLATLKDGQSRIVPFDRDPLPVLRALAEGRLPDVTSLPGEFEIEITPDDLDPAGAGQPYAVFATG